MPKDGRGKKTGKAKPDKGGAPLADRVARLRAQIEELSRRLASAEETLIAAGGVALAKGESRMSRLLELTDAAGARLEAELGAAVEALFEGSASDSRKAPGPAPAAPPAPAPRPAPARRRKQATSSPARAATNATRSTPRKSTPRQRTSAKPASTTRATPTRSTGTRVPRTPSTGTTRGAGAPSSRRGRRTPPTPPA